MTTRTKAQNSMMHALAGKCGLSKDDLRDYAAEISAGRTEHTSELSVQEAAQIINRLQSFVDGKAETTVTISRRTLNWRRAKTGNITEIVTPDQLDKIERLRSQRGIGADGLAALCKRMLRGKSKPNTVKDAQKIIEALKAMIARDAVKEAA